MTDAEVMLAEFHDALGQPYGQDFPGMDKLRIDLHDEEGRELIEAIEEGDLAHLAKELADVIFLAYGTAHVKGIPMNAVLAAVHASNMTKIEGGVFRSDGKLLKGPHYRPPDIAAVLAEHGPQ